MHQCFGFASNTSCQTSASVFEDLGIKTTKSAVVAVHLVQFIFFSFFFSKLSSLISFLSLHHTRKFGFAAGVIPHTRWSPVVPNVLERTGMIGKCESVIRDLKQMWASSEKIRRLAETTPNFKHDFCFDLSYVDACKVPVIEKKKRNTFVHRWTFKRLAKYSEPTVAASNLYNVSQYWLEYTEMITQWTRSWYAQYIYILCWWLSPLLI